MTVISESDNEAFQKDNNTVVPVFKNIEEYNSDITVVNACLGDSSSDSSSGSDDEQQDSIIVKKVESDNVPTFGKVSLVNSNDIQFGNRTVYQGPVTIKQFLYANGGNLEDGYTNNVFNGDSDKCVDNNCDINKTNNNVASVPESVGINGNVRFPKISKGLIWLQTYPKQRPLEIGIFLTIIILSLCILMVVLFWKHPVRPDHHKQIVVDSDEQDNIHPIDYQNDLNNISASNKLHIVTRQQWVAQPPIQPAAVLPTPVPLVIIHHTATENCSSQAQCVFHVRYIQTFHIESNDFWDIGYNFLVGGDGNAYEGRGWKQEGAHTFGYNSQSIGIAFIGSFLTEKPPERQLNACKKLIEKGIELGYIRKDYKLMAVRQLRPTESPGLALFEEIKTWPHWVAS